VKLVDPDGRMQRDEQGKLIAKEKDEIILRQHPSGYATFFEVFYLFTDDETEISAWMNLGLENHEFDSNCHGYTFADGEYWIESNQVRKILEGDNYKSVDTPQEGDIVVYWDNRGGAAHSAKVVSVDQEGGVQVEGISGIRDTDVRRTTLEEAWPFPATPQFYRKENGVEQ
jgi:hypothetical protein